MKPSEDRLIGKIAAFVKASGRARSGLHLGIGDDAALLKPLAGHEIILSCDWFLEGTHFLTDLHPPDSVGWKCLARALSDVAAMGGQPQCFLLSLALPDHLTGHWLTQFLQGLRRASRLFRCPLAGGDTTRKREAAISVTVAGDVRSGRALLRSGARPGDLIFVSGYLGLAELGLRTLRGNPKVRGDRNPALAKHLYPEPRLRLGRWLAERRLATSLMDLSDGLSTDLTRLCAASRVGARIESARLPLATSASPRTGPTTPRKPAMVTFQSELLHAALHGGDDYELLFTVPRRLATRIPSSFDGTMLTHIGHITRGRKLILHTSNGDKPLHSGGWDPFRST
jgi:thiamine-monophosphate kinase